VTDSDRLERTIVSVLLTCGELSGESVLTWCLYGIGEHQDARTEMMRVSQVLVKMNRAGHLTYRQQGGAVLWKLKKESAVDWVNEVLLTGELEH
jgi:hypothetical protein